jgi:hypothetical protein
MGETEPSASAIPKTAEAVAGYVGGHWPTYNQLVKDFPHAHKLSIAVFASEDADCLDIEKGDATPDQDRPLHDEGTPLLRWLRVRAQDDRRRHPIHR